MSIVKKISSFFGFSAFVGILAFAAIPDRLSEPIKFIGHGAMFSAEGKEFPTTIPAIADAQSWYMSMLKDRLGKRDKHKFELIKHRLLSDADVDAQTRLVVQAELIDWLLARAQLANKSELEGKLLLLKRKLKYVVPPNIVPKGSAKHSFTMDPKIAVRLREDKNLKSTRAELQFKMVTGVKGEEYRKLCADHGVPLPPDFGPASPWMSQGIIDGKDLFIVRDLSAEVLTYTSSSPAGMCIALPRFGPDNIVLADGIICFGQIDPLDAGRAKVCFWDNQDPKKPLESAEITFPRGATQSVTQFAGGSDLRAGAGGICSSCHAGENPYVIHGTILNGVAQNFSAYNFAKTWYEPIVRMGDTDVWPENPGPIKTAPQSCTKCHNEDDAGRLPMISPALTTYCRAVLRPSVGALAPPVSPNEIGETISNPPASMPPTRPGSFACTPNIPTGDPRKIACTPAHTAVCTPTFDEKDSRKGNPLYEVKCTPDLASLLNQCEVTNIAGNYSPAPNELQSLTRMMVGTKKP